MEKNTKLGHPREEEEEEEEVEDLGVQMLEAGWERLRGFHTHTHTLKTHFFLTLSCPNLKFYPGFNSNNLFTALL